MRSCHDAHAAHAAVARDMATSCCYTRRVGIVVQKFGGTSMGSVARIQHVATRVAEARDAGHDVVVVVSAMAGETNRLLQMGREIASKPAERELDVLASTGEQVSASLLALALGSLGHPAQSMLAHQVGIETDNRFTRARIRAIHKEVLLDLLAQGCIPVVAGFQGRDAAGNITTLGRGGTDTSAVAIAAALNAEVCDIFTDVDGVYTADPNVCPSARKVARISYEEMLELASLGAKVLQIRSVELAMKFQVPVHVRTTFAPVEGTMVVREEEAMESVVVSGVTSDKNATQVTVRDVPDEPGIVAALFEPLARENVSVDMIIQTSSAGGNADITFTVNREDAERVDHVMKRIQSEIRASSFSIEGGFAKVSIVGLGMRSHAGVAARMFRLLADERINVETISTSEIKVSCLIRADSSDLAVRTLHDGFGLGHSSPP